MPQRGAPLNRVHPACPIYPVGPVDRTGVEFYFFVYSIGVKFTSVIAERISLGDPPGVQLWLNPQRQFNWGVLVRRNYGGFHWDPTPLFKLF